MIALHLRNSYIEQCIQCIKLMITDLQEKRQRLTEYKQMCVNTSDRKALTSAVSILEAWKKAEEMMPKERTEPIDDGITDNSYEVGYNSALKDCAPIVAKLQQENAELKKKLRKGEGTEEGTG